MRFCTSSRTRPCKNRGLQASQENTKRGGPHARDRTFTRACTRTDGSSPDHTNGQPLDNAPVGEPILLLVQGHDAPVVAIQDEDGDWQVTWNGDVITEAISNSLHRSRPNRPIHFSCAS